jgi:sugar/nucleoside kinase (ribokinase family)
MHDVYLYGMISPSTVHILDESFLYPGPNEYAEIKCTLSSLGGEATNSAIMLSKLGIRVKLDGNWINKNHSAKILNLLKTFEIDASRLKSVENYGTEEVVIADKHTRTVFGNYASFHKGERQWNDPNVKDIKKAKFVSIDPYFREQSIEAARICLENRKPYATLDCRYDDYLAIHADAVIISHELRDQAYKDRDMNEIFDAYLTHCNGLIIFTFGSDELWYARPGCKKLKFKPFEINAVDTTGAGDSFRAGIIYGLINLWNDEKTIEFASAVAACVCLTSPHTLNAPGLVGIEEFISANKI